MVVRAQEEPASAQVVMAGAVAAVRGRCHAQGELPRAGRQASSSEEREANRLCPWGSGRAGSSGAPWAEVLWFFLSRKDTAASCRAAGHRAWQANAGLRTPRDIGRSTHNGAAITRTPAPPAPAAENRPVPSSTPGIPPARHPYPAVSAPHDAVCIPSARRGTACSAGPGMHWPDAQTGAGRTPARRRAGGKGEPRPHHRHKGEGGAWTAPTRADPNTAKRARQAAGAGFAQVNGAGPGVRPTTPAARRIVR